MEEIYVGTLYVQDEEGWRDLAFRSSSAPPSMKSAVRKVPFSKALS